MSSVGKRDRSMMMCFIALTVSLSLNLVSKFTSEENREKRAFNRAYDVCMHSVNNRKILEDYCKEKAKGL